MKITESELEVMKLLWSHDEPLTFTYIRDALHVQFSWSNSTVKTLINRLVEKQAVRQEKREVYYYSSLVDQASWSAQALRAAVRKLSGGTLAELLTGLIAQDALREDEISELRQVLYRNQGEADHE